MSFVNEPLAPQSGVTAAPAEAPAPRRRGWPVIAWLVIAGAVLFILVRSYLRPRDPRSYLVPLQSEARRLVGFKALSEWLKAPGPASGPQTWGASRAHLERGPYDQRLRAAILAGELAGPGEAREVLRRLEADRAKNNLPAPPSEEAVAMAGSLDRLYAGYELREAAPWRLNGWFGLAEPEWAARGLVDEATRQRIRDRLGWFGDLAVAAPQGDAQLREEVLRSARHSAIALFVLVAFVLLAFFAGAVIGVVLIVLALIGRLGNGLSPPTDAGGVYAEAFALYMLLYIGLSFALSLALRFAPWLRPGGPADMALGAVPTLGSLVVLAWPPLRGVPWSRVRQDVGLTVGPAPWKELLAGVGSYLCAIPLLLVAIGVTLVLGLLQKLLTGRDPWQIGEGPSHPANEVALTRDPWAWVGLIVMAVVLAPLIEEIIFRGLLYRHLREATRRAGTFLSVAAATLASGFVFAVIHPQGLLGVPVLMALASSFALTREWRGSLLGPMVAHGLNNGLITLLMFATAA